MSADNEQFDTRSKKPGRGKSQRSLDLIEAMYTAAEAQSSRSRAAASDTEAWARCDRVNKAEQESLKTILAGWKPGR